MKILDFEAQLAMNGFADVNGTRVYVHGVPNVTENEALQYIEMAQRKYPDDTITTLDIKPEEGDNVDVSYAVKPPGFQRIRRITGYLVGTLDRFNDSKRAEEHDRVKHTLRDGGMEM